jgi:predicted nucleic acid-binding protein
MLPVKVIPDTCAWIDFFSGRATSLSEALEQSLGNDSVTTCGVVIYELLQGIRSKREEEMILLAFEAVSHIEMTRSLWVKAGRLSATLRRKGVTIPFSDIVIASIALENSLAVMTIDRHFEQVQGLRVISAPQENK